MRRARNAALSLRQRVAAAVIVLGMVVALFVLLNH